MRRAEAMVRIIITGVAISLIAMMYMKSVEWYHYFTVAMSYTLLLGAVKIIMINTFFKIEQLKTELEKERKIKQSYEEAFNQIQVSRA